MKVVLLLLVLVCVGISTQAILQSVEQDVADAYTCYGTSNGFPCSTLNATCFDYWENSPSSTCVSLATLSFDGTYAESDVAPSAPTGVGANATISETYYLENNIKNVSVTLKGNGYIGMADGFMHYCKFSFAYFDFGASQWVEAYQSYSSPYVTPTINVPVSALEDTIAGSTLLYLARTNCKGWSSLRGINVNYIYDTRSEACQGDICCRYDEQPFLTSNIDWSCTTVQDAQCLIGIFYNDTLITVSPSVTDVNEYGRISILDSKNGILNFRLDTVDLYPEMTYNVTVFCHSNISTDIQYSGMVTPQYKPLGEIPAIGVFIKDNMGYIVGFGILVILLTIIIIIIKAVI